MKRVHKLLILIFLSFQYSNAQEIKTYILFPSTSNETCSMDIEGEGVKEIEKYRKIETQNIIYFKICEKDFTFLKDKYEPRKLTNEEFKNIKFINPKLITREWAMKHKNPLIYLVEKNSEEEICLFQVGYIHDFISID